MADGQIDIKEDGAPTKQLASQTHLHGGTTVHAEEIVIVDSAGNLVGSTAGRLNVDGSGVTQPVSDGGGAITVDALNLDIRDLVPATDEVTAQVKSGLKGASAAALVTSTVEGVDHQALDVQIMSGGVAKDPTAIRALTTADAVNAGQWIGSAAPTVGQKAMASSLPVAIASDQSAVPISAAVASPAFVRISDGAVAQEGKGPVPTFRGSISSFRTPGRAGTAGQKILSLHNATGSTIVVRVTKVTIDLIQTVVKAITVAPPIVRLWKVTVLPTNGTALTKISRDTGLSVSSASVILVTPRPTAQALARR